MPDRSEKFSLTDLDEFEIFDEETGETTPLSDVLNSVLGTEVNHDQQIPDHRQPNRQELPS